MFMKPYAAALIVVFLAAVSVVAREDNKEERGSLEPTERLEFRRDSRPEGQRYSFEDYIQDLTAAARSDEPLPDNPASEMAFNKQREYKPLNPIPLLRW
jgi:hypothetical protein